MAKNKAVQKKKLLPYREVTVKSHAYGEHKRAARGNQTPVAINDVLRENVRKTAMINTTAKRVHDLLKHCGEHFKEKMLWQVMLGRMRKGTSDDMISLLMTLDGMELNAKYPLHRFARPYVKETVWDKKGCEFVTGKGYPHLKNGDTEYRYEVFLLTLEKTAEEDGLASSESEWMKAEDKDGEMRFAFTIPKQVVYYLVCLHFMTGNNGKETGTLASRGMRIVEVGKGNYEKKVETSE